MVYVFAGLAVVLLGLWRLAVSGRTRWRKAARYWEGACNEAIEAWGARCLELQTRIQYLEQTPTGALIYERDRARELYAQTEVQLIDSRRGRDEAWRERDRVITDTAVAMRGMMADLGQAHERNRDLQERLTAMEARGVPAGCPRPNACALAPALGWDANGSAVEDSTGATANLAANPI